MNNNDNLVDLKDLNLSEEELFKPVDNSTIESEKITAPRYSYWKSVFRVFFKKKINTVILAILAIILIFTYVYPIFAGYDRFENLNTSGGKHLNPEKAIVKYIYNTDPEKYTLKEAKARYFDNRDELKSRLTAFLGLDADCTSQELQDAISQSADKFLYDLYVNKTITEAYSEYIPCAPVPATLASSIIKFATENKADDITAAIGAYTAKYVDEVYGLTTLQAATDAYSASNANIAFYTLISNKYNAYLGEDAVKDDSVEATQDQQDFEQYFEGITDNQMTEALVTAAITDNAEITLKDCLESENPIAKAIAGYMLNSDNAKILAMTQYFESEDASKTLDIIVKDSSSSEISATLAGFLTSSDSNKNGDEALKKIFSGNIASMTLDQCIASGDTLPATFAKFYIEYYYGIIAFIDVCADFFGSSDASGKAVASAIVSYFGKTQDEALKAEFTSYQNNFIQNELSSKSLSFATYASMAVLAENDIAANTLSTSIMLDENAKQVITEYKDSFFASTYSKKTLNEVFADSYTDFSIASDKRDELSEHEIALRVATKYNGKDFDGDGQAEFNVTDPEQMVSEISSILKMTVESALNSEGLAYYIADSVSKENIVTVMALTELLNNNADKTVAECKNGDAAVKAVAEFVTSERYYNILTASNIIDGDAGQALFIDCKAGTGVSSLTKVIANLVESQSFYNNKTLADASADFMSCPVYADKLTDAFSRMLFSSSIARGFEIMHWILGSGASGESTFDSIWYGSEISISLALICAAINMTAGVVIGAVWGFSKSVDVVMTEVYNIIGNVPYILFISVMVLIFSPSFWTLVFALTVTGWLGIAYFIRTQVIIIRDREYNLASRCLGTPILRLTVKNILPFMTSVIVTLLATEIPAYISYEVFLSYIGMGMSSNGPLSLGKLIQNAQNSMLVADWCLEFWSPVVIASIITIVLYVVGQNLGDASDPRTHM